MGHHTSALERRYDGHIPAALRLAARELDAAETELRKDFPILPVLLPRRPSPAAAIARMAGIMILRSAASDACLESDLTAAGFTRDDIARYGEPARALAATRMGDAGAA